MSLAKPTPQDIIDFWFEEAGPAKWYAVSAAFDAVLRRRFGKAIEREAARYRAGSHPWLDDAEGALALILLFDQFPRNVWRGSGKAFEFDPLARDIAEAMIDRGLDWAVAEDRRAFVYLPFMHSEALADQDRCIALAQERLETGSTLHHARKHREVIEPFGRFPYRNEALGRSSTAEEIAYLDSGGYAPGRNDSAKSSGGQG
jgi:uncharacterized protein (DUF924 family)